MDDSERSQELLDNVDISHLRTDVVKLSAAEQSIKTDEEGEPPPDLINSQYINIHRVPEALGKTLVDCNSPTPQTLISGELMGHHIVHGGMVVDMMAPPPVSSADFSQHTAQYIPEHYDADDDLLSHELTEEDRRLAAALVAVQIVHQEKQQHPSVVTSESNVIVSPNGLSGLMTSTGHLTGKVHVPVSISDHHMTTMSPMSPSAGVPDEKPGMAAMVSSYIQAVEEEAVVGVGHLGQPSDRILKMYQPGPPPPQAQELRLPPLPPLKKVLSSQSIAVRSGYSRSSSVAIHEPSEVDLGDTQLPPEPQHQTLDSPDVRVVDATHLAEPEDLLKEEYDVKSEGIDDDLGEESDDNVPDDNDSDYDVESDLRPSRRSLPHKKRIPRKLKNPKKASPLRSGEKCYKCMKCGEQFISQSLLTSHKLIHISGKRVFNCELCGKGFANQLKFFEHLKSHYEPSPGSSIHDQPISKNMKDKTSTKDVNLKQETEKIVETPDSLVALPPPLVCNECGKTFRRQKAFESHVNMAHPKQEEIEEFSEPEDLMEGIQVSVDGADGDTDEGEMDCLTSSSIVRSLKNSNDKDWYREEDLHAAEADLQEMEQQHQQHHQQLHHGVDNDNVCELCGEVFDDKRQFDQHFREEHMEFIDHTDPSVKEFEADTEVKDETGNPSKKRVIGKKSRRSGMHLTCPQCGRMFNHRNSLVYHLRSHSGERPHQCEVCGKSFFAASALKVHMRLHSGDKPYKCEFCGRYFRQYGDLKYHCTSIHSEEKNYQCEYCGKDFARKYSLIVHRRIHTGEKNYKCEFCGKSFRASSYLQNHRRIHTGEKPHPCEVCGKPFRVRSDMKRHLNTHNRDRQRNSASNGAPSANGANSNSNSNSAMSECPSLRAMLEDTGKLKAEPDEDQLDPSSLQPTHSITVEQTMTEMSVADITLQNGAPESILPDEALSDQQPINLNIAVPAPPGTPRQATTHHQLTAAQAVPEEVLHHYARDPLDSVRDGNNTLYVWPIYMA